MIIESIKVATVVRSAICLTRDICNGVDSLIGARVRAPSKGISISPVSIIN